MGKNIITFIEFLISIVFICYSILQHLNLSVWFFVIAELLYFCITVAEMLFFEKKIQFAVLSVQILLFLYGTYSIIKSEYLSYMYSGYEMHVTFGETAFFISLAILPINLLILCIFNIINIVVRKK